MVSGIVGWRWFRVYTHVQIPAHALVKQYQGRSNGAAEFSHVRYGASSSLISKGFPGKNCNMTHKHRPASDVERAKC